MQSLRSLFAETCIFHAKFAVSLSLLHAKIVLLAVQFFSRERADPMLILMVKIKLSNAEFAVAFSQNRANSMLTFR